MLTAGTLVTVILKPKRMGARGGTLVYDWNPGEHMTVRRDRDIDWSGFGERPTGTVDIPIGAEHIKSVHANGEWIN